MSGDLTTDDPETGSLPACPSCGKPIAMLTMTGPTEGIVTPCGCRVPPNALE